MLFENDEKEKYKHIFQVQENWPHKLLLPDIQKHKPRILAINYEVGIIKFNIYFIFHIIYILEFPDQSQA